MASRKLKTVKAINKQRSGQAKSKTETISGTDFLRKIDVFPIQLLDGDIKLVYSVDISPSSFPNTRLELISNTYQMYRFTNFTIKSKSILTSVINGLFIGYIDTDPQDAPVPTSSDDILRIAKGHQASFQKALNDNWTLSLPMRSDDQMFFIGDQGDTRLRKMGKLYIFQVGKATKFDGSPVDSEISAASLEIEWTCKFSSPQLQQIDRIFDAESQKNILRIFSDLAWYRRFNATGIDKDSCLRDKNGVRTNFRQANFTVNKDMFARTGTGSYMLVKIPIEITIPNTVKAFHTLAMPYDATATPYSLPGTDLYSILATGAWSLVDFKKFVNKAFGLISGGIETAKEIYDVVSLVSSLFVAGQATGTEVDVVIDEGSSSSGVGQSLPIGHVVIHWDGQNQPVFQELIEFNDVAHATDPSVTVNYSVLVLAFKIMNTSADVRVDPNLPNFRDTNL